MAATVNIDPLELFRAYMAFDMWKRQREQQKFAPTQQMVEQRGWQGAGEALGGEKPLIDLWSHMFGKKTPLPQETTWQTQTTPTPEGGLSVAPTQPRTRIQWPSPTSGQMLEQGAVEALSQPGAAKEVAKGKLGYGTPYEIAYREMSKRYHIATLSKDSSDPEIAMQYWGAVINGEQPSVKLPPATTQDAEWKVRLMIAPQVSPLYGKSKKDIPSQALPLVDTAIALKISKWKDGVLVSSEEEVTEAKAPEYKMIGVDPKKPETHELWQKFQNGKPVGEPESRIRWKPEGGVDLKEYASYDLRIKDDARSMATRELVARGVMKIVRDPLDPMRTSVEFAVPAEQGDKLFRESFAKHYKDAVRGAKSQGYLPKTWKEDPYGESEAPVTLPQDLFKKWQEGMRNKEVREFKPTINPSQRGKEVVNPEGSVSSERTITIEMDGKYYNIPSLVGGEQLSKEEAAAAFRSGKTQAIDVSDTLSKALKKAEERSEMLGREKAGNLLHYEVGNDEYYIPKEKEAAFIKKYGKRARRLLR